MKRILTLTLGFFIFSHAYSQSEKTYLDLMSKASLFHLQKDYRNAIIYFEKAFALQLPDPLNAYKAAGVYSLDSNDVKAFKYLNVALSSGWVEADLLSFDPYFDYLRNSRSTQWIRVHRKAFRIEKRYAKSLRLPDVRKQVNLMTVKDQSLRYKKAQLKDKSQLKVVNQQISETDTENLRVAKAIIAQYGWPRISDIGKDGQNNLWLLVQHSDRDIIFQQYALSAMENIKDKAEINLENYAFLFDRVQCNLNFKQLYGTQVDWIGNGRASGFRSIIQEDMVDDRRKAFNLSPLNIYALSYGFEYKNVSAETAKTRDSIESAYTKQLIDSAKYFYEAKNYEKSYDLYNSASTILGGMTSADNYDAAVVFTKIYSLNKVSKYKDIALDFLSLLYQRQEMLAFNVEHQTIFSPLHAESRWAGFFKQRD